MPQIPSPTSTVWIAGLYRMAPDVLDALKIVRPETVIRWHRAGFRAYWRGNLYRAVAVQRRRWKWPVIREISLANPLWGAPRLHGGFSSSASMSGKPPLQSILRREGDPRPKVETFLHNHATHRVDGLFVVPDNLIPTSLRVPDTTIAGNPVAGSDRAPKG